MQRYTTFEYLYRDASNYKAWGGIILVGILTESDEKLITQRLESGEFFIAEQIGIPSLYEQLWKYSEGEPNDDDHAWHSVHGFHEATSDDLADFPKWGIVEDFVTQILMVKEWRISLSPNYSCQ